MATFTKISKQLAERKFGISYSITCGYTTGVNYTWTFNSGFELTKFIIFVRFPNWLSHSARSWNRKSSPNWKSTWLCLKNCAFFLSWSTRSWDLVNNVLWMSNHSNAVTKTAGCKMLCVLYDTFSVLRNTYQVFFCFYHTVIKTINNKPQKIR